MGGSQAIAAMAYGTESVAPVNKIVGPGSKWVALAKKMVFLEGLCGIESANMGPSEILCWADASTSPDIVASSMLAQNEHDKGSMSILLTKDKNLIKKVKLSISNQLKDLPRKKIASNVKKKYLKYFNSKIVADFIINKTLKTNQMESIDKDSNIYKSNNAIIDLKSQKLAAKDIQIYFAKGELGENSRLKGSSLISENNISCFLNMLAFSTPSSSA